MFKLSLFLALSVLLVGAHCAVSFNSEHVVYAENTSEEKILDGIIGGITGGLTGLLSGVTGQ